jgi:hypothetical protein
MPTTISSYSKRQMLDWLLGGATATQPSERWVALTLNIPTSVSGSEVIDDGYSRQTAVFGAADPLAVSASNTEACVFGPFSSANIVVGMFIADASSGGNMLPPRSLAYWASLSRKKRRKIDE